MADDELQAIRAQRMAAMRQQQQQQQSNQGDVSLTTDMFEEFCSIVGIISRLPKNKRRKGNSKKI